jgi:hypothetical protein
MEAADRSRAQGRPRSADLVLKQLGAVMASPACACSATQFSPGQRVLLYLNTDRTGLCALTRI